MEIRIVENKKTWDDFVAEHGEYSAFLQSWEWNEFQKRFSRTLWRSGCFQGGEMIAAAAVLEKKISFGFSYVWISRGPILKKGYEKLSDTIHREFLKWISEVRTKEVFARWEPLYPVFFSEWPARKTASIQPRHTLVLDLHKETEVLFQQFHPKTRYNIRLAEKKGVSIRFSTDAKDGERFLELIATTARRDRFRAHPKEYYGCMFENLLPKMLEFSFAEYQKKTLAANICLRFGKTMTYLHGASSDAHRNVMAPHLLQWNSILRAKETGCRAYDFWGIAPEGSLKEKAWSGVTRFKRGFGGREKEYPEAKDMIFSKKKYAIYSLARRVKRMV